MNKRVVAGLLLGGSIGFLLIAAIYLVPRSGSGDGPEQVSQAFYLDTYVRDFSSAWDRVSTADQFVLSKEAYLAENPISTELQSELLELLASSGEFETIAIISTVPTRAVVSAHVRYPQREQEAIEQLLNEAADPGADRTALISQLEQLHESDQLEYVEGDVTFDLVSEDGIWRIAQHWGQSVTVHLSSAVSSDLPWDFYPLLSEVTVLPGELVSANYFARNNSDQPITAKAIHEVGPSDSARYFQTIECFCFAEQTLEPGEEREMMLLFRIDLLAPSELTDLDNLYTFYSLESFPSES